MIRYLDVPSVITIHDYIVPAPVLNLGLLESAVGQPQATFGGRELYETMHHKAAVLMHGLASNHAFQDGNKRTAWSATQIFLAANQAPLYQIGDEEAADFVEKMIVDKLPLKVVTEWLIYRQAI